MRVLMKLALLFALEAMLLTGIAIWGLGGPSEAYAIARLDRLHAIPIAPWFGSTCYPSGFSNAKYLGIAVGDTQDAAKARLGEPLRITWSLDEVPMGRFVVFEPSSGRWVSTYAHGVTIPDGTPMASLEALHHTAAGESWHYSRSCTPDSSLRVRGLTFRRGRVTHRWAGIWYD